MILVWFLVGNCANDSIRNYLQEVRLLFQFHNDKQVCSNSSRRPSEFGYLQNHSRAKRLKGLFIKLKMPAPPARMRIPVYVTIREKFRVDRRLCPKCNELTGVAFQIELVATHCRGGGIYPGATMAKEKPKNKASPTDFLAQKNLGIHIAKKIKNTNYS